MNEAELNMEVDVNQGIILDRLEELLIQTGTLERFVGRLQDTESLGQELHDIKIRFDALINEVKN